MKKNPITDINQNFWQLACIQSTALGIPSILVGSQLAKEYGSNVAIPSVFIGNLLLWMMGLGIISMTFKDRQNAMENVKSYLGKSGGIIASLILVLAFVTWYVTHIDATTSAISEIFDTHNHLKIKIGGVILGVTISLLSMGGIRLIKRICVISFPLIWLFIIYKFFISKNLLPFEGKWGLSFFAIITSASINLPGIINLPTFFRHAHSKADAYLALTLTVVFTSLFEISSIFLNSMNSQELFITKQAQGSINFGLMIALTFILLSVICSNLVNIYFASAGWEMIMPHRWSSKEYAIVGLLGTAVYYFSPPMEFLRNATDISIWILGYVLLITFLAGMVIKHRSLLEKAASNFCWYFGVIVGLTFLLKGKMDTNHALIAGISMSTILFLVIAFARETIWSINKIKTSEKTH